VAQKKVRTLTVEQKRELIDPLHAQLSIARQCALLELGRASYYREAARESEENLQLMRAIDEAYMQHPTLGSRMFARLLGVNRKRVQRLMRIMGIEAIYARPRLSQKCPEHRVFPYLLRGVEIVRCDQVWSTDITYVPMPRGFMYLTAVLDWHSRYVLAWELSNTLDATFCLSALNRSLALARPEIFNTDQGSQFTSMAFTSRLQEAGVAISMDGRGRWLDNVFVERLWRTVKYDCLYLHEFATVTALETGLTSWFAYYNESRLHSALAYRTPAAVYGAARDEKRKKFGPKNSGCARL
jgi:putative transposase